MRDPAEFIWQRLEQRLVRAGHAAAVPHLRDLIMVEARGAAPADPKLPEAARYTTHYFSLGSRRTDVSVDLNAFDGDVLGWHVSVLAKDSAAVLSPQDALQAAQSAVEVPADAVLEASEYESIAGQPVFVVSWRHVVEGVVVERDYLRAYVNGRTGRVFAIARKWHDLDSSPRQR